MRDFTGKFVFATLGVWYADWWLAGIQIGSKTDRWPMKLAIYLLLGLLMAAVSGAIKPVLNMLNLPSMMITIMLIWMVVGTLTLWLLAHLAKALALPFWITDLWWDGVVAALVIGWFTSLMEPVNPPPPKK